MFKFLTVILILIISTPAVLAETKTIKNSKGQTIGYYKIHTGGKVTQRDKYGILEYTYKKNPSGRYTKYSKYGRKLESYQ